MNRVSVVLSALLWTSAGLAQQEVTSPEEAVQGEEGVLYTYENEQAVPAANLLDMIYECNRAAGSIMDVDGDGAEDFRIYGFDYVDSEVYALEGPRTFSTSTQVAQTRAMGSATEFLFGVASSATRALQDSRAESNAASSTGAPGSDERERISALSVTTQEAFQQIYATSATGVLKGGRSSGTKFVSLGEGVGYCVIVRYDIPLDQTAPAPGEAAAQGNEPAAADSPAAPSEEESGGYPQLPTGAAGDF